MSGDVMRHSVLVFRSMHRVSFTVCYPDQQMHTIYIYIYLFCGADKSLARPTSGWISFDGENIYFDASLVVCINSINIPPIMIINGIYGHKNLLLL